MTKTEERILLIRKNVLPMCVQFSKYILDDPEDLFQDMIIDLLKIKDIPLVRFRAKQLLIDRWRYSKRRVMKSLEIVLEDGTEIEQDVDFQEPADVNIELQDLLNHTMSVVELEAHEKTLIYQHFYLGMTLTEIGIMEGKAKNTMSNHLKIILNKIRDFIFLLEKERLTNERNDPNE